MCIKGAHGSACVGGTSWFKWRSQERTNDCVWIRTQSVNLEGNEKEKQFQSAGGKKTTKRTRRTHSTPPDSKRNHFSTLPGRAYRYDGYQFAVFLPKTSARVLLSDLIGKVPQTAQKNTIEIANRRHNPTPRRLFIILPTLTGAVMICGEELHSFSRKWRKEEKKQKTPVLSVSQPARLCPTAPSSP